MPKTPLNQAEIFASDLLGEGKNADTLDGLDSLSFMRRDETTLPTEDDAFDLGTESMRWRNIYVSGTIEGVGLDHMLRDDADAIPAADLTFDIGSPTNRWGTLYVDSINGSTTDKFLRKDATNLPTDTALYNLGASGLRWNWVYAVGVNTSGVSMFNGETAFNASITLNGDDLRVVDGSIFVSGTNTKVEAPLFVGDLEGTAASAKYADLAERYSCDSTLEIGTVVTVSESEGEDVRKAEEGDIVLGVVSENPAFLMNSAGAGPAIGLVGRVPVLVSGNVKKGQRLTTSNIPGRARAAEPGEETFAWANESAEGELSSIECILMKG